MSKEALTDLIVIFADLLATSVVEKLIASGMSKDIADQVAAKTGVFTPVGSTTSSDVTAPAPVVNPLYEEAAALLQRLVTTKAGAKAAKTTITALGGKKLSELPETQLPTFIQIATGLVAVPGNVDGTATPASKPPAGATGGATIVTGRKEAQIALLALINTKSKPRAVEILAEFGVEKLKDIPDGKLAEVTAAIVKATK